MSNSTYAGLIPYQTTDISDDDPFDAAMGRTLVNNAIHLADSAGAVRVSWASTGTDFIEPQFNTTPASTEKLMILSIGIPLTMTFGGNPFKLRIRFAGFSSSSNATVDFNVGIGSYHLGRTVAFNVDALSVSTTSTTSIWFDPGETLITLSPDLFVLGTQQGHSTEGGTGFVESTWHGTTIQVFGGSTDWSLAVPRLTGLYVAEWVGV